MVVENQSSEEKYIGATTTDALNQAALMVEVLSQAGVSFADAFKRSAGCTQLTEEVPRTNRQESFGKLFRKKGQRW
ncbi:hypothetical protein ABQD61_12785 [Enterococcus asini]|uniref:hypothetical protein n=1 Tax=Enterococcus asini TaxID=57732 RepID=UPI0032E50702